MLYQDRAPVRLERITLDPGTGFIRGTARVTRVGVFSYNNKPVLRSDKEVFNDESMKTLDLIPITRYHPDENVTADNVKTFQVGTVGKCVKDGDFLVCPYVITDKQTIQDILDKKITQISCGYNALFQDDNGTWRGESYASVQKDIRYNHVAIVDVGRAGPDVALVVDRKDEDDQKQEKKMAVKRVLDNINVEFENEQDAIAFTNARDSVSAKLDAYQKQVSQLTTDSSDAEMQKRVQKRVALEKRASVLDSKADFSKMSEREVRLTALKVCDKADFTGKSDAYIEARFDFACDAADEAAKNTSETTKVVDSPNAQASMDKMHKEMVERNRSQHEAKR